LNYYTIADYTPTHSNTLVNNKYTLGPIQKLDFTSNYGSNSSAFNATNTTTINKFSMNSYIPSYNNNFLLSYPQTPQNVFKSLSFVNNNFHHPYIPINTNNIIPFDFNKNNNLNTPLSNNNNKVNVQNLDVKFLNKEEQIYNDYKINLENIISGKDKRTTIMLRNIPNKYTLPNLVEEINQVYLGKIDYINLPIDYEVCAFFRDF